MRISYIIIGRICFIAASCSAGGSMDEKTLALVQKNKLFGNMSEENTELCVKLLSGRTVAAKSGEIIMSEGEPADRIGIVLSGSIQVIREDYYGNRDIAALIRQGGSFAEVFVCSAVKLLPVTIEAAGDCTVMLLDYGKLSSLSSYPFYPQFVSNLLTAVSDNALMLNRKVEIISKRSTKEKIMAYLSYEAKRAGNNTFTVPLDRRSMADYLGVERSAMSARLSELVKEGRIMVDKNTFTVLKCHCGLDNINKF